MYGKSFSRHFITAYVLPPAAHTLPSLDRWSVARFAATRSGPPLTPKESLHRGLTDAQSSGNRRFAMACGNVLPRSIGMVSHDRRPPIPCATFPGLAFSVKRRNFGR
jgi:hypothetical protein